MFTYAEVQAIVDELHCPPFEFMVTKTTTPATLLVPEQGGMAGYVEQEFAELVFVQAWMHRKDTHTNEEGWGHGALYFVDPGACRDDVVRRCFAAARDFAEHEVREAFHWRSTRVLGPHVPLEELLRLLKVAS